MKNLNKILIPVLLASLLTACGKADAQTETASAPVSIQETTEIQTAAIPRSPDADPASDIDLTTLSSTMVYSQVADMMYTPEKYVGQVVKAKGLFSVYHDDTKNKDYFAVLIQDATACCAQGLEFVWEGDHVYPDDYPEAGKEITVMGKFNTYQEDNGATYCQLLNAELTVNS